MPTRLTSKERKIHFPARIIIPEGRQQRNERLGYNLELLGAPTTLIATMEEFDMMQLLILVLLCIAVLYLKGQLMDKMTEKSSKTADRLIVVVIVLLWLLVCLGVINLPVCLRG